MTPPERTSQRFILVVDDDADIRESMEMALGMHGHAVATAADGQQAIQLLRGSSVDPCIILLDLMMPGMDGFELHAHLQADPIWSHIPVVIVTGAGALADERAGALHREILRKPFPMHALLATVNRFCQN